VAGFLVIGEAMKNPFYSILILFVLLVSGSTYAQYDLVDEKVKTYPAKFTDSKPLADKIAADFKSDAERARAIFTWIALNINYDVKAYYTQDNNGIAYSYTTPEDKIKKDREFRMSLVKQTLKTGKAVCEGYASLLSNLAEQLKIEAVIIPGTSKSSYTEIGKSPKFSDHAWNALKIDGKWELVDVTWAAGVVNSESNKFEKRFNDAYFFTAPEKFFLNHFAENPKWLLTEKTAEDFAALPFYYPSYLTSDYSINADEGFILFPKDVAVRFNIKNLKPTDRVSYITSTDNMLERVVVDEANYFIIPPSAKLTGYITIFVNERPLVSYKILKGRV
jgi:transglutaminase/protease-like cytokinesis protein 3